LLATAATGNRAGVIADATTRAFTRVFDAPCGDPESCAPRLTPLPGSEFRVHALARVNPE
jgi:hypothetical protein